MAEPFNLDTGARYAFAPYPEPIEGSLHRICIVFEGSDGRHWTAGTELMAATRKSAEEFADRMNARLGFDYEEWTAFAERIFAANPYRKSKAGSQPSALPE